MHGKTSCKKSYTQILGIDFREIFVPVAKMTIIRVLIVVVAQKNWDIHQMNITNVFFMENLKKKYIGVYHQG